MTEDEIKRLTEAFGRLTGDTDELSEQLKKNLAQQDVYTVAVKKTNDAIDKEILSRLKSDASLVRGQQVYEQQMRSLGLAKNALGEFERATVTLTTTQKKRLADEELIANRQKSRDEMSAKYHTMMADKTGTLIKGLQAFGSGLEKTVFDSTKGQSKYGELMNDFGSGIQSATNNLGPFGKALGFAAGGLLKLVGAAFKQQEVLNKAYENLSEFGALDATGIDGMFKALQSANFVVKDIDKFQEVIKGASGNLATMGTSVADGVGKFTKSIQAATESGADQKLRMLGFTSESIAKTFVDYQGMMARTGMVQDRDARKVSRESTEYAKTLDQLAKLTGATRDEMQKRADADANDLKFRLTLQDLQKQDVNLYKKVRDATLMVGEFGPEAVEGFREMIAGGGQVIGDASAKLSLATGGAAEEIAQELLKNNITAAEANRRLAAAALEIQERYREQFKLSNDMSQSMGQTVKLIDGANKMRTKTDEEFNKLAEERGEQERGDLDAQRRGEVARQKNEIALEKSRDRLNNLVGKGLVESFEKLQLVLFGFSKKLAEYLFKFGGPDFTDLFLTENEIKNKLAVTSQELEETNQKIASINKNTETNVKKKAELESKDLQIQQLQIEYSKATTKEKKIELNEQLQLAKKEKSALETEYRQTGLEINRNKLLLPSLQKRKLDLEAEQEKQQTKFSTVTSTPPVTGTGGTGIPSYLQKVAQVESSGKAGAKNPESSASGLFQFTASTWKETVSKMGKDYSLEDRFDPSKAAEVAKFFTEGQAGQLEKALGRAPSETDLYMAHFLGAGGAIKFLRAMSKNPSGPASEGAGSDQIEKNKPIFFTNKGAGRIRTLEEVYGLMQGKIEKAGEEIQTGKAGADISKIPTEAASTPKLTPERGEVPKAQTGGLFSGPKSGYPVLLHGTELIIPMPNTGDLATMLSSVTKTPLNEAEPTTSATTTTTISGMDQFMALQNDFMNMMATKLDALESRMAKGNDIQENILTYSMG